MTGTRFSSDLALSAAQSRLLCALCGPITEEEIQTCRLTLRDGSGVVRKRRCLLAQSPLPWRELRAAYRTSRELQDAVDRLEQLRNLQEASHGKSGYTHDPEKLVARVRCALVTGKAQEFGRLYDSYSHTLQALSDQTHLSIFWEQVLGPGLEGAAEVPGDIPRRQLAHLISSHFALSAYPADSLVCGRDVDTGLATDILYELRSAHREALLQRQKRGGLNRPLASAALSLLRGEWKEACSTFCGALPDSLLDCPPGAEAEMGILYLYAALCAIRAEAPAKKIVRLLNLARRSIDLYLDSSYPSVSDLISVTQHLEWVFSLLQHTNWQTKPRQGAAGAALAPLLWGTLYQMPSERRDLDEESLPSLIRGLQDSGLLLAAAHAASCAQYLVSPTGSISTQLQEILPTLPPVAPLTDPQSVPSPQENQKKQLEEWVSGCEAPRTHLYWDLTLNEQQSSIQSIELHLADAPELTGKLFSPRYHLWDELTHLMDSADRNTEPLQQALLYSTRNALREVSCLIGHPRVRVLRDGEYQQVDVRGQLPVLQIKRQGSQVTFYQQAQLPPHRLIASTENSITLPMVSMADLFTREHFRHQGKNAAKQGILTLESPDPLHLQEMLSRLSLGYDIQGDILPPDIPPREASPELLVELSLKRRALCPRLLLRLLPDSSHLVPPGSGMEQTLLPVEGPVEGQLVSVHRDWENERQLVRDLLRQCPDLHLVQTDRFCPQLHALRGERNQIRLLQQLRAAGIRITWAGNKRLSAYSASKEQFTFTVEKTLPGWLEIGGQLEVDEQRVIPLAELLASTLEANRLILEDGTIILTDEQVTTLLRRLMAAHTGGDAGHRSPGTTLRLSHAALPSLCEVGNSLLPPAVLSACPDLREKKWRLPSGLQATLRDYQLEGYRWMCTRAQAGIGMCLADDMGLGKTIQTLALLLKRASEGAALIVAPLSLLGNWKAEAARFAPALQVQLYPEWDGSAPPAPGSLLLASYGQLASSPERARSTTWHTLVLDEAQTIRNASTKRAQTIRTLTAQARVALTGTPIENGLGDLWSIMEFLNPGLLGSLRSFRTRYRNSEALPDLHTLVRPLILRRTRQQVLRQLPVLTEIEWKIPLSAEERALYEASRRRALKLVDQQGPSTTLFAELTRLRRICCHGKLVMPSFKGKSSKLDTLLELITELRASGHKTLIFSQFTDVLDLAEPMLNQEGIRFLRLDGTTRASRRTQLTEQFQRGEADCFLISLKAGGVGLNLTAASYVILLDPWWNPAVESQAAARSHRIGQTRPVTLYRLIAEETVEERVLALHQSKKQLAEAIITEGTLPLSELRTLLES